MTDRDLLERAAKAAGIRYDGFDEDLVCDLWFVPELSRYTAWNPLTDDGDALRLAVKLGIHQTNSDIDAWATHLKVAAVETLGEDPYAATRRAIVRAAAAMAKED